MPGICSLLPSATGGGERTYIETHTRCGAKRQMGSDYCPCLGDSCFFVFLSYSVLILVLESGSCYVAPADLKPRIHYVAKAALKLIAILPTRPSKYKHKSPRMAKYEESVQNYSAQVFQILKTLRYRRPWSSLCSTENNALLFI